MKKYLTILLFLWSCATTVPTSKPCPTCPPVKICPTCPPIVVCPTKQDTVFIDTSSRLVAIPVYPLTGDNWQELQTAIDYVLSTSGTELVIHPGDYPHSRPLVCAIIENGVFKQVCPRIRGLFNTKNAPASMTARLLPTFNDGPAICIQQGKGGYIKDISIKGTFNLPSQLNQIQIDTLSDWSDGSTRQNRSSPYAGIVFDPFSDPSVFTGGYEMYPKLLQYYLPGMNRSGTTATTIDGVKIDGFIVGFLITPGNQQNGEIINLYHSQIANCKTAYAICQAQSKQCEVRDFECWGNVRTIFDNMTWGIRHGDGAGSPMIDGANIAGWNYQVFQILNYTFNGSFTNIYAEGVFKVGMIGGNAGAQISNSTFDFGNNVKGVPTPDYYIYSPNTIHTNVTYRIYGGTDMRITVAGKNNLFVGGHQNWPPIVKAHPTQWYSPEFQHMSFYYTNSSLNTNLYDTVSYLTVNNIHINKSNWTAWFTKFGYPQDRGNFADIKIGDMVVTQRQYLDILEYCYYYPVGYVSKVSGDTVFLQNAGVGINDNENLVLLDMGLKNFN